MMSWQQVSTRAISRIGLLLFRAFRIDSGPSLLAGIAVARCRKALSFHIKLLSPLEWGQTLEKPESGCLVVLYRDDPISGYPHFQANTPAVSCMRADTSPRWCSVSPNVISSWVSFLK